jgi:hypothetical protein
MLGGKSMRGEPGGVVSTAVWWCTENPLIYCPVGRTDVRGPTVMLSEMLQYVQ